MTDKLWRPQKLNLDKPLYIAIADALEEDIQSGILKPGYKLPPQRELAELIGVNLSTLTRAFRECELRGLVTGTVGRGTYIAADVNLSTDLVRSEETNSNLLEMGLVLPLYCLDTNTTLEVHSLIQTIDLASLLRYTEPNGLLSHREAGSAWLNHFGLQTTPRDILITSGSQNALACCLISLFNSGDRIAVEALTYPGIKNLAAMLGIRLVPVEMDAEGIIPDALANACRRDNIRGIFLMPEVQNPTTVAIPEHRREQIASLIKQHDLILIEDESYGYTGELKQIALSALVPNHGIYISGISKLLGAGFRISYVAVPSRFRNQLERAVLNTVWMSSPINAEIVSKLLISGKGDLIMQAKREEARLRTEIALEKLAPYTVFSRTHGLFLWMHLPDGWTGREFELSARAAGVKVFCAEKFMVGNGRIPPAVRISLTGPETKDDLIGGLAILKNILSNNSRETEMIF